MSRGTIRSMRERVVFLYIITIVGVVLSFALGGNAFELDSMLMIIAVLLALVLCSVAFLLNLAGRFSLGCIVVIVAAIVTMFTSGSPPVIMVGVVVVYLAGLLKLDLKKKVLMSIVLLCFLFVIRFVSIFWHTSGVSVSVDVSISISTILIVGFSIYVLHLMDRLAKLGEDAEGSAERAEDMKALLGNQRRMTKNTEQVSRLEERNRLAARIHDEIGHGMSGSILLLEGADMVMDKEPEKARETIRKVTENLRGSVEEIRKVLREERSLGGEVSVARIENELAAFENDHPRIKTKFEVEGDMSRVSPSVLTCVYENMVEAMTNVLKHSAATEFNVSLKNSGALLTVEFADNGGRQDAAPPCNDSGGMGLQNMEERAAMCYGRCFFRHEADGFHIVMTFPRRDNL